MVSPTNIKTILKKIIVVAMFLLMPLASIIEDQAVRDLYYYNPMHSFIDLYRQIVLAGELPLLNLQIAVAVSLLTYVMGGWLFMRIKHAFGDVL